LGFKLHLTTIFGLLEWILNVGGVTNEMSLTKGPTTRVMARRIQEEWPDSSPTPHVHYLFQHCHHLDKDCFCDPACLQKGTRNITKLRPNLQ